MAGNDVVRHRSEPRTAGSSSPTGLVMAGPQQRVVGVAARPAGLHRDRVGHPAEVSSGDAEVQVPAVPGGDAGEPVGEVLPGGEPDQLVAEVAVGQRVLGAGGPGFVDRRRVGEELDQRVAVVEGDVRGRLGERGQPGLVREDVPDRRRLLAVGGVRRPQVGDGLVEAQGSLGHRGQHGQRGERLGARVGHRQRVGGPGPGAVERAGHCLVVDGAVAHHAGRRTGVAQLIVQVVEDVLKGAGHRLNLMHSTMEP